MWYVVFDIKINLTFKKLIYIMLPLIPGIITVFSFFVVYILHWDIDLNNVSNLWQPQGPRVEKSTLGLHALYL